jgi:peptidoglycan/xylan/chitin deacetylase (PgdA/CDA1 family)
LKGRGSAVSRERGVKRRFLLVVACFLGALVAPAIAKAGPTIVSLTFDDGTADEIAAQPMLSQHGLHATFYINSNNIGASPSFMTWDQVAGLAADGNEIGGHTLDHVDLTSVNTTEATRQVCSDRQALVSHGFAATDFAYPYGASNSSVESIVQGCGYKSARKAWGLCLVGLMPPNCNDVLSEPIPPRNTWEIAVAAVRAYHTLTDIEGAVTRAEDAGGGWVVLLFHHVCDGCDPVNGYSVSPAILSGFLDWLAPRSSSGTSVRTMSDVMGDKTAPTSAITCNGSSCSNWYSQPVSVSLSATDTGTAVTAIRYTTDGSDPTASSALYTGPFNVSTTTTVKYRAWDMAGNVEATKSQLLQFDSVPPVSAIACNGTVCSSSAYAAPVSVSLSATDSGGSGGVQIHYETNGSDPSIFSPLYVSSFTVSTTTTVKYRAWDSAGNVEATNSQLIQVTLPDTTPPTSAIACNGAACSSSTYTAPVSVSLSASDPDDAVAAIRYTTDGSDPTSSSTLYTGSFTISTTTTVKYRAWDTAGNAEATNSQLIQVTLPDTTPPTSAIACNGASCTTAWYAPRVSVTLSASDPDDAVAAIRYTTDGSGPTNSSTLYTGAFSISTTTTVKYRAWDTAGNIEATKSQLIQVDTFAPTVSITSPVNGATVNGNIKIVTNPADAQSGVASVAYYVDGVLAGTLTSSPWQLPWNTKKASPGQHVLTAVATDRAGNRTTSAAVTVTVR